MKILLNNFYLNGHTLNGPIFVEEKNMLTIVTDLKKQKNNSNLDSFVHTIEIKFRAKYIFQHIIYRSMGNTTAFVKYIVSVIN